MGARKTNTGVENVYDAAQEWVNKALRADDSMFTPGRAIWTLDKLRELHALQQQAPDPSLPGFFGKLEKTLEGSPPGVYQLAAEMLYFQYLLHYGMTPQTKGERINRVLEWSGQQISIPDELAAGLTPGIAKVGPAMGAGLPNYFGFLIEFVERWKEEGTDEQHRLLHDPWQFKHFSRDENLAVELFQPSLHTVQRHALLHLVFPDTFEGIVSDSHKSKLAQRLAAYGNEDADDVDRRIQLIRQGIEAELGRDFDFYDGDIQRWWDPFEQGYGPPYGRPDCPLGALGRRVNLPVAFLKNILELLEEKRQVIFHGPPGTGKTFVATELARFLAGSEGQARMVQFHPSYAYEDFVQGFRPKKSGDGFELRDGPLLQIAEQARGEPEVNHYLVIDEINRGNLGKILGELYFLLEYRDEEIQLQYSDQAFSLPENLRIIGTMNTADRSIALVDLALRRRFYFVEFHPAKEPVKDVLRKWLEANAPDMMRVAGIVDEANRLLSDDPHAAVGPSYFMRKGLDEDSLDRIWEHSVKPYIEERLFHDRDRLQEFALNKLREAADLSVAAHSAQGQDAPELEDAASGP